MQEFTKDELRRLRERMNQLLGPLGREFGIEMTLGSITYTGVEFTASLKARRANLSLGDTPEAQLFTERAKKYGLRPETLGQVFWADGRQLRVLGWLKDCSTNVISLEDVASGKQMKCPVGYLKLHMPASAA